MGRPANKGRVFPAQANQQGPYTSVALHTNAGPGRDPEDAPRFQVGLCVAEDAGDSGIYTTCVWLGSLGTSRYWW